MFLDEVIIEVGSGKGGDGMVHFRKEKYIPRGGPDGGDGGKGGDVILKVHTHVNTLYAFQHQQKFYADNGRGGGSTNKTGKSADNLIIPVPPGTIVFDAITGDLIGDLTEKDQELVVAKGGRGGKGNQHYATSRNQVPRMAEKGEPGEERSLRLELKLIADIGLVGVPNAGKSSLLAATSNARPKIADYPFTTLVPNLGVVELDLDTVLVLADIPGLIEGAHKGVGLGFDFLKHVQRTRVLVHLLDGMSDDPLADFSQINSEMALFDPRLEKKPQIVALNKMDLPDVADKWDMIKTSIEKKGYEVFAISAVSGLNVRKLLYRAHQVLQETPAEVVEDVMPVYRADEDPRAFTISREDDGGWRISGKAIERAAAMTYWEHRGPVRRFQRILNALGIERALRQAGIQEGDNVYVGEYALEWQDDPDFNL